MEKRSKKSNAGPKDKSYVNKNETYETVYEKKRKQPAKQFGNTKKKNS